MSRRRRDADTNPIFLIAVLLIGLLAGGGVVGGIAYAVLGGRAARPQFTGPSDANAEPAARGGFGSLLGPGRPYSTRVKEKTLPVDQAALDTPLRSHREHPWVRLVKAEIEKSDGTRMPLPFWRDGERIVLDYESSADFATHAIMSHAKPLVMLKNEKGETTEWHYENMAQLRDKGTWLMVDGDTGPFAFRGPPRFGGRFSDKSFTPNMEVFVILEDWHDRNAVKRFKISNSLMIGDKAGVTLARDWKDDEVEPIEVSLKTKTGATPNEAQQAAVTAANAAAEAFGGNAPANVQRSATIGAPGGWKYEFAKDAAPALGLAYTFGAWDNHPSIGKIRPVFKDIPVPDFPQRVMAKPGYAVGGVKLEASPFISKFQVVFMKLDGQRLNPADSYTSDWIRAGNEPPKQEATYLSDGKLVIGVFGNNGAVVNTMGLIFQ